MTSNSINLGNVKVNYSKIFLHSRLFGGVYVQHTASEVLSQLYSNSNMLYVHWIMMAATKYRMEMLLIGNYELVNVFLTAMSYRLQKTCDKQQFDVLFTDLAPVFF